MRISVFYSSRVRGRVIGVSLLRPLHRLNCLSYNLMICHEIKCIIYTHVPVRVNIWISLSHLPVLLHCSSIHIISHSFLSTVFFSVPPALVFVLVTDASHFVTPLTATPAETCLVTLTLHRQRKTLSERERQRVSFNAQGRNCE